MGPRLVQVCIYTGYWILDTPGCRREGACGGAAPATIPVDPLPMYYQAPSPMVLYTMAPRYSRGYHPGYSMVSPLLLVLYDYGPYRVSPSLGIDANFLSIPTPYIRQGPRAVPRGIGYQCLVL
jgi:hypothetical protein